MPPQHPFQPAEIQAASLPCRKPGGSRRVRESGSKSPARPPYRLPPESVRRPLRICSQQTHRLTAAEFSYFLREGRKEGCMERQVGIIGLEPHELECVRS